MLHADSTLSACRSRYSDRGLTPGMVLNSSTPRGFNPILNRGFIPIQTLKFFIPFGCVTGANYKFQVCIAICALSAF